MNQILIVEDNLEMQNYKCTQAFSGTEALMNIEKNDYALIILDLMLPGLSGEDFINKVKLINS